MNAEKVLGKGTFAVVSESKDSPLIAVKKNKKPNDCAEIRALLSIDPHPNIIKLLRFGVNETRNYWLELPRFEMDLLRFIQDYQGLAELDELFDIATQIVEGLVHIHSQGWIHRDVKPDNIFIDNTQHIVIADFGFATPATNRCMTIPICAPTYRAPEIATCRYYSREVDIFSTAATIYELFMGKMMFNNPAEIALRCAGTEFTPSPAHLKFMEIVGEANSALWKRCLGAGATRPGAHELRAFSTNRL